MFYHLLPLLLIPSTFAEANYCPTSKPQVLLPLLVYSAVSLIYSFILDAVLEDSFQLPGPTPSMLYSSAGREEELYRQRHSHMPIDEREADFLEKDNTFYQKNSYFYSQAHKCPSSSV